MRDWFHPDGSVITFLRERRPWLAGADHGSLIPGILRLNKAAIHISLSELEPAERELELVRTSPALPMGLELGYLYHACNLYYQFSLWDKMDPVRERLLSLARSAGCRPDIARGLHFTGLETINSGDYQQAIGYFMQALDIERDLTDTALLGEIYNDIGFCYRRIGDTAKAEEYYIASLRIREQSGYLLGQAESLSNLGFLKIFQGQPQQAESLLSKAYQLETQIGDRLGAGYTLVNLGYLAYQRGEFSKAKDYHQRALDIRIKLNDPLGQGHCYLQLHSLAGLEDNAREELELLNKAYQAFVRAEERTGQLDCRIRFADFWQEQMRLDVAGRIMEKMRLIVRDLKVREINQKYLQVEISLNIKRSDREKIVSVWEQYHSMIPDQQQDFDGMLLQARVEEALHQTDDARASYQKALELAQKNNYSFNMARAVYFMGCAGAVGNRGLIEQALSEFQSMGAKRMARKASECLAKTERMKP